MKSDSGSEDITLAETDAWLHGSARIGALPKKQATLTLTLYDKGSAPLASFTGTLGTDGAVSLEADDTKATRDLEVLAVEVFEASGSHELAVDLAGADTDLVAYATVTVNDGSTPTAPTACPGRQESCASAATRAWMCRARWFPTIRPPSARSWLRVGPAPSGRCSTARPWR